MVPEEVMTPPHTQTQTCPLSGWIMWPTTQGSSTRTTNVFGTFRGVNLPNLYPEILWSPLGVLGSLFPSSSPFLHIECTCTLEAIHTQDSQGQGSLCYPLGSDPQGPILRSCQCHLLGGGNSQHQASQYTWDLRLSPLLCLQHSLKTKAP